jgi:hypothetical protein
LARTSNVSLLPTIVNSSLRLVVSDSERFARGPRRRASQFYYLTSN